MSAVRRGGLLVVGMAVSVMLCAVARPRRGPSGQAVDQGIGILSD